MSLRLWVVKGQVGEYAEAGALYQAALARAPENTLIRVSLASARIQAAMFQDQVGYATSGA